MGFSSSHFWGAGGVLDFVCLFFKPEPSSFSIHNVLRVPRFKHILWEKVPVFSFESAHHDFHLMPSIHFMEPVLLQISQTSPSLLHTPSEPFLAGEVWSGLLLVPGKPLGTAGPSQRSCLLCPTASCRDGKSSATGNTAAQENTTGTYTMTQGWI